MGRGLTGRKFAAIAYPVAVGTTTGEVVQARRMVIGGVLSFLREVVKDVLESPSRPLGTDRCRPHAGTGLGPHRSCQEATLSTTAARSRAGSETAASGATSCREARMRTKATTAAAARSRALTVKAVV